MKNLDKIIVAKLPTPLINLIGRQISMDTDTISENAGKMLSKIDWSRARDEERLAYAELMYPKGVRILSTFGTDGIIKKMNKVWEENNGCLYVDGHSDELGDVVLEIWNRHKWAEIIEEPVASIGNIGDKKNTESVEYIGLRPEFKAGDMVDYIPCSLRKDRIWRERVRFTGGITSDGEYVIEFQNKTVGLASEIRKRKPDVDEVQSLPDHVVKFRIEEIESKMEYLMESIEELKKGKNL